MLATRDVLLTDETLMGVLGFNAVQVERGSNERGLSRRTRPVEVRGAFSFETVADNIVEIGADRLAAMFNGAEGSRIDASRLEADGLLADGAVAEGHRCGWRDALCRPGRQCTAEAA